MLRPTLRTLRNDCCQSPSLLHKFTVMLRTAGETANFIYVLIFIFTFMQVNAIVEIVSCFPGKK
jgi:hypothetical protein